MGAEACKPMTACCDSRTPYESSFIPTTALHSSAYRGSLPGIKFELDKGVDVDMVDERGLTALHFAAKEGHLDAVTELIKNGATTSIRAKGLMNMTAQEVDAVEQWFGPTGLAGKLPEHNPTNFHELPAGTCLEHLLHASP
ncbi:hypothetical protein GUITHDRAFT_119737 [Guillardia theta CCMP2712]|uniref:Uncharacterized protein n=1 Tax=Guillardia theta (strain CCMP2712) TaxID=905079 RepID=L1ID86_GUITC|nr:hypothetical protein GUITHDRAFT_119737 [Guillardia theta CCMP2712]EKX34067.1 hypothetical protein GUITHDRAFT_119737 [Guillardia theta CCMP2712]|eukprot:XP_005821047.1 hypothetical protein GUITHDRAFT_119737 [Guillardia theta CCMP2712]